MTRAILGGGTRNFSLSLSLRGSETLHTRDTVIGFRSSLTARQPR